MPFLVFFPCSQIATSLLKQCIAREWSFRELCFNRPNTGQPGALIPSFTSEGSSYFGRQAECCPHGEAERAPPPPTGCRQNEAPHRTERANVSTGERALLLDSLPCSFNFLESLSLSIFLHSFSPFPHR